MSNTIFETLLTTEWTDVSGVNLEGYLSAPSGHQVLYRESATKPADSDTDGHTLNPRDNVKYKLDIGQRVYCRATDGGTFVAVTPGVTFSQGGAGDETPVTAYGDSSSASLTPITQISGINGFTDKTSEVFFATGTNVAANGKFTCSTGTTAFAFAATITARQIPPRPGEGSRSVFSASFTAGIADSQQLAGPTSSTDGVEFGFQNTVFGIFRRHNGSSEIQELQVTTPASGAENATVTIEGTGFTVPLTAGTVNHNALEIANSLNAQVPNWIFTSTDDTVTALGAVARPPAGAFSFSSATAVAAFTQISLGARPTEDFTPQTSWNVNPRPDLDPTKDNLYSVSFKDVGAGAIFYHVENPTTSNMDLVHQINHTNTSNELVIGDPTMPVGWTAASLGSTTDLAVSGSGLGAFIEGPDITTGPARSFENTLLLTGITLTNLASIRNRIVKGDFRNRATTKLLFVSGFTDSTKGAVVELLVDATVAGDQDFQYVDKDRSTTEIDVAGTTVTGGTSVGTLALAPGGGDSVNLEQVMALLLPGQTLTLAAAVIAVPASDITAALTFQEDI